MSCQGYFQCKQGQWERRNAIHKNVWNYKPEWQIIKEAVTVMRTKHSQSHWVCAKWDYYFFFFFSVKLSDGEPYQIIYQVGNTDLANRHSRGRQGTIHTISVYQFILWITKLQPNHDSDTGSNANHRCRMLEKGWCECTNWQKNAQGKEEQGETSQE